MVDIPTVLTPVIYTYLAWTKSAGETTESAGVAEVVSVVFCLCDGGRSLLMIHQKKVRRTVFGHHAPRGSEDLDR